MKGFCKIMKKIAVITSSRADFGIMKRMLWKLNSTNNINLCIIATGMHMSETYGYTYKNIIDSGFQISDKIQIDMTNDSPKNILEQVSALISRLAEIYEKNKFDMTIILGDRYEMLAAANVSMISGVPICHLHGGEATLGNYDEFVRNAITKMSHLHLTSTDTYRKRVIQMGENPDKVINIGAMGVENVLLEKQLFFEDVEQDYGIAFAKKSYYVVLYHPVTLQSSDVYLDVFKNLIKVLTDENCVFIGSNSDNGSKEIRSLTNNDVKNNKKHIYFNSLPTEIFHNLVENSKGLIGNSSSGLIEVPSLGVPTLNIGNRQKGRIQGPSVVNTGGTSFDHLQESFKQLELVSDFYNPYYQKNSSQKAVNSILSFLNSKSTLEKKFYDVKFTLENSQC